MLNHSAILQRIFPVFDNGLAFAVGTLHGYNLIIATILPITNQKTSAKVFFVFVFVYIFSNFKYSTGFEIKFSFRQKILIFFSATLSFF
jgi:hypothetical protein